MNWQIISTCFWGFGGLVLIILGLCFLTVIEERAFKRRNGYRCMDKNCPTCRDLP